MSELFKALKKLCWFNYYIRKYANDFLLRVMYENENNYDTDTIANWHRDTLAREMPNYTISIRETEIDGNKVFTTLWVEKND